jgi:hypothetical protein
MGDFAGSPTLLEKQELLFRAGVILFIVGGTAACFGGIFISLCRI